jgi:hypothetical protein
MSHDRSGATASHALLTFVAGTCACLLQLLVPKPLRAAPPAVLQRGYDANVTNANLSETALNTGNVSVGTFGLVFSLAVDDNVFAQPLYVPNVTINQVSHNVIYVATMSDTVFAFDADSGTRLWAQSLLTAAGAAPVPMQNYAYSGNRSIVGNLGILSTPVIDPNTNTLYAVTATQENSTIVYRLHALDITTGTLRSNSGVQITGSYGGLNFNGRQQWQRISLVLAGNNVIFGFGALEQEYSGGYVGWMMAYDKTALAQTGIFATITSGANDGAGVWQSGRPPAVDSSGYVYVFTGNSFGSNGYDGVNNFGESVLKLDPSNGLALKDWFTPSNWLAMDNGDLDLTSSGPTLIPGTALLVGGGKTGIAYLLSTASLGHESSTDTGAIQKLHVSPGAIHAGPVWWQRSAAAGGPLMYNWSAGDSLKAWAFNGSTFVTTPVSQGSATGQIFPGGYLALSANGETAGTGVIWASTAVSGDAENNPPVAGELHAYDASNLTNELWNSAQNASRDKVGNLAKFTPPLVVNGRVYMATASNNVAVYGLLGPPAAIPTFSPLPGTYSAGQPVSLADTTTGAAIYYTLNGATPNTNSILYTGPIILNTSATIDAIAVASGSSYSAVASGTYTITGGGGGGATAVSLSSIANVDAIANSGAAVPNGGIDTLGYAYSEALLGAAIAWNGNAYSLLGPDIADAASNKTIPLPVGNYSTISLLGTAVNGNQSNQTFIVNYTDGSSSTFTQSMSDWATPQNYSGESQVLQMAYRVAPSGSLNNYTFYLYGYTFALNSAKTVASIVLPANRHVVVLAIDVGGTPPPPPAATPTFSPLPGTYSAGQPVSLSDTTVGAAIYYTLNGTTPNTNSTLYTGPITLNSTRTINAIGLASGYSSSTVASGTYTITGGGGGGATAVSLSTVANVDAIANSGTAVPNGGIDTLGYAYSEALLGASIAWNGNAYSLLGPDIADAASNKTIPLPAGNYSTISLLGTAVNGNQPNQTFTVNYTDGTSSTFTQSMSDWATPQNYISESQVLQMAYRVTPSGSLNNYTFYLYGYSFALNSAKTVASIVLPANRHVVVLAIDVGGTPPPPPAATPTFSPLPGTYSAGQPVSLSDTTAGAAIYYTLNGTTPNTNSTLYTGPITLNSTTTINAIAVASGYSSSTVTSGTYTITGGGGATAVTLSSVANVDAIANSGTIVLNGGLDGLGYAYSEALLGASIAWNGNTYSLLGPDIADAASNKTIPLPAGNYSTISLLGTGVNGNQANQTLVVNYTDGSSSTFTQSVSDWNTPQNYSGESQVLQMAYRIKPNGSLDNYTFYLYGYSFALNSAKTVASIVLPATGHVVMLAVDLY